MVQEVQTGIGITNETTLETIEAIGTSSFKIIEGRQTKGGHYVSGCQTSGSVNWAYSLSGGTGRDSGMVKGNLSITDSSGKKEYAVNNGGIRVPVAGTYELTIYRSSGSSTFTATIYVKGGGKTIYTKKFNASDSETVVVRADLGKFDLVELWGEFYYDGSATTSYLSLTSTISIQQL